MFAKVSIGGQCFVILPFTYQVIQKTMERRREAKQIDAGKRLPK